MNDKEMKIRELTAQYAGEQGPRLVLTLIKAVFDAAEQDAFTNTNGDVQFIKALIKNLSVKDWEVESACRDLAGLVLDEVCDFVEWQKRQKWSADRQLEKELI